MGFYELGIGQNYRIPFFLLYLFIILYYSLLKIFSKSKILISPPSTYLSPNQ